MVIVDRIKAIAECPDLRLDPNNLQNLCVLRHSAKTSCLLWRLRPTASSSALRGGYFEK
jgi:hypothetical protein